MNEPNNNTPELAPAITAFAFGQYMLLKPVKPAGLRLICASQEKGKLAMAAVAREDVKVEDRVHFDNWMRFFNPQGPLDATTG